MQMDEHSSKVVKGEVARQGYTTMQISHLISVLHYLMRKITQKHRIQSPSEVLGIKKPDVITSLKLTRKRKTRKHLCNPRA